MIRKHQYKNAYVEETINNDGEVVCYKQWDNGVLIIHREWEIPTKHQQTMYVDVISGYWQKTSRHNVGNLVITNKWDNKGRQFKHYYDTSNKQLCTYYKGRDSQ